ncbi:MAG TPA: CopD family protein [Stellaceae bacterium]|nr:CopD family protein [Stellaceae bacterium]
MALLLDIFGFLSVVLRGLVLTAQSLTVGGVVFLACLAKPLAPPLGPAGAAVIERCGRLLLWSAIALAVIEAVFVTLECLVLAGSIQTTLADAFAAEFARFGAVAAAAAAVTAALAARRDVGRRVLPLLALAVTILLAQVATSHAAAQLSERAVLLVADFMHMLAAAVWIGGIPYFLIALSQAQTSVGYGRIGQRFSHMSMAAVALLLAAGIVMAVPYVGSVDAIYGTAYGVMVATKVLLLASLLVFGALNNRLVQRARRDPGTPILRLRRFAEVEIGLGLTVLFAAASLTSQPPAVDLTTDRASLHEVVERLTPHWPRLTSPDHASLALSELQAKIDAQATAGAARPLAFVPGEGDIAPRNAEDIAWSEYNHHWAGIFVLAIGLLALLERSGRAPWAKHWPLLFLALALFLFVRSDPEVWPLGKIGFWTSLRDPEVVQHRIFVALIAAFGIFEWRVRTGRNRHPRAALVFPVITALGGALLLTHSHALSNVKDQLLIEISHVPLALCGIAAGWGRWLELRLDDRAGHVAAWVWPVAFVLVGLILLSYREA